jgi:hypothetical protein
MLVVDKPFTCRLKNEKLSYDTAIDVGAVCG